MTASGGHCSGNQVNFGELRLGENYIVGDSRTWETSVVSWNASTNTLTIRPAGGNELGTLILVPSSILVLHAERGGHRRGGKRRHRDDFERKCGVVLSIHGHAKRTGR